MARRVKVTMSDDRNEIIEVADDYTLEPAILEQDGWLHIPTAGGGEFALPMRLVVAVVLEDRPTRAKRARS